MARRRRKYTKRRTQPRTHRRRGYFRTGGGSVPCTAPPRTGGIGYPWMLH